MGVSRDYYAGRQRGLAEGEERATERIIKLLEPLTICEDDCDHYDCGTWALKQGIALIKEREVSEYLNPKTLTPEELYGLQSETWSQGYEHGVNEERERWRSWLTRVRTWNPTKMMDFVEGGLYSQDRIMQILRKEIESIQKKIDDSPLPVNVFWQDDIELIENLISLIEKSE